MKILRALLLLAVVSCDFGEKDVAVGLACRQQGEMLCLDERNGAVCVNGKFEKLACEGPTGCTDINGKVTCLRQSYRIDEPCFQEGAPQCTQDGKALLTCENSHWRKVDDCKGPLGCAVNAEGAKCDLGSSAAGEACSLENEGNAACTEDAKAVVQCRRGRMELASSCKGALGCRREEATLECDSTLADVGDPCPEEGALACATQKTARLVCKDGKMTKEADCSCSVVGDEVACK